MSLKHIVVGKVQELVIDDMYLNILLLLVVAKLCTNEDLKAALAAVMSFWRLSSALANLVLRLAEGFLFCFLLRERIQSSLCLKSEVNHFGLS